MARPPVPREAARRALPIDVRGSDGARAHRRGVARAADRHAELGLGMAETLAATPVAAERIERVRALLRHGRAPLVAIAERVLSGTEPPEAAGLALGRAHAAAMDA